MAKENKKWIKFRHKVIRKIFYYPVKIFCKFRYGVKIKKFRGKGSYLILANHQTDGDQLFTYLAFSKPSYTLATEDIFSNGFKSRLLEYAFAPLPIDKTSVDINSVRRCVKVVKEGGSVCIFPEGNRTYSGRTEHIKPAVTKLIKLLKLPVAVFKIEGGYGVQPRWARSGRKGRMIAHVTTVISPEEYKDMDNDALFKRIQDELFVNEASDKTVYKGKNRAEYIERVVYTCPKCGLTEWESKGNDATCKKCGLKITYNENKTIESKSDIPFTNTAEWIDWQNAFINNLETEKYTLSPAYVDRAKFFGVKPYKSKKLLDKNAEISLFSDRITVKTNEERAFYFNDLTGVSVLGRNKLNFNTGSGLYQFKGSKRFNSVKYINFYYNYKNKQEENSDGFLGL